MKLPVSLTRIPRFRLTKYRYANMGIYCFSDLIKVMKLHGRERIVWILCCLLSILGDLISIASLGTFTWDLRTWALFDLFSED